MGEIYITDEIRLTQAESKHLIKFRNIWTKTAGKLEIYSSVLISTNWHRIIKS